MLGVYGHLRFGGRWYWRRLACVNMVVVWGGDIVAGYLHRVGASRGDDLCGVALVVGRGGWGHRVHGRGNVRVRGG